MAGVRDRAILDSAKRLFYERGYDGVGVDEIGAASGVTGPAIYRHFTGKEEILATLFDEAMVRLRELGFDPSGKLVSGEPTQEIAAYAAAIGADLLVVGHRKKSLFERWWSGQTGAYLMDHVGCSLLIARRAISDEEFYREFGLASATSTPFAAPQSAAVAA